MYKKQSSLYQLGIKCAKKMRFNGSVISRESIKFGKCKINETFNRPLNSNFQSNTSIYNMGVFFYGVGSVKCTLPNFTLYQ